MNLAYDGKDLLVSEHISGNIYRIDTNGICQDTINSIKTTGIETNGSDLWIIRGGTNWLCKIDINNGQSLDSIKIEIPQAFMGAYQCRDICYLDSSFFTIWGYCYCGVCRILKTDLKTKKTTDLGDIPLFDYLVNINDTIWSGDGSGLYPIYSNTSITTNYDRKLYPGGFKISGLAYANNNIWVIDNDLKKLKVFPYPISIITDSQTEATKIDSICNLMSGYWYKVIEYSGLTGKRDSVYSNEINIIERIAGTDSIMWSIMKNNTIINTSKFKISYSRSLIFNENRWMLANDGFKNIIDVNTSNLTCSMDAYDGGGIGYSRNKSSITRIPETDNSKFLIYSNPVQTELYISGINEINYVNVFDMKGRLVLKEVTPTNGTIDISKFKSGLYFVQVISKSFINIGKIIIK